MTAFFVLVKVQPETVGYELPERLRPSKEQSRTTQLERVASDELRSIPGRPELPPKRTSQWLRSLASEAELRIRPRHCPAAPLDAPSPLVSPPAESSWYEVNTTGLPDAPLTSRVPVTLTWSVGVRALNTTPCSTVSVAPAATVSEVLFTSAPSSTLAAVRVALASSVPTVMRM